MLFFAVCLAIRTSIHWIGLPTLKGALGNTVGLTQLMGHLFCSTNATSAYSAAVCRHPRSGRGNVRAY